MIIINNIKYFQVNNKIQYIEYMYIGLQVSVVKMFTYFFMLSLLNDASNLFSQSIDAWQIQVLAIISTNMPNVYYYPINGNNEW